MLGQRGVEVSMAGFIHDPLGIVNLIADNLRDRCQTDFPVIKDCQGYLAYTRRVVSGWLKQCEAGRIPALLGE